MRRVVNPTIGAIAVLAASASAAFASRHCDELWFTRNWVMDQAGYCFGSALGQATFGNSDCLGEQIALSPAQTALVGEVRRIESIHGCSVDTGRAALDFPELPLRMRLTVQPMPHEEMLGWGCLGYAGREVALHAAPATGSAQVGRIDPGDWVSVGAYQPVDGWMYVSTHGQAWGSFRSGGWTPLETTMTCEQEAG